MKLKAGMLLVAIVAAAISLAQTRPARRVFKSTDEVAGVIFKQGDKAPDVYYVVNYSDLITHLAMRDLPMPLKPTSAELNWGMQQAIDQKLLHYAAGSYRARLNLPRFKMADIDRRTEKIARTFASREEFEARVKLINEQHPANSIRLKAHVLDQMEIARYFALEFPGKPLDTARQAEPNRLRPLATIRATKLL